MSKKISNSKILFVDCITLSSLRRILTLRPCFQTILHFEPLTSSGQRWLNIFRRLGLIRAEVRQIQHYMGQVQNETQKGVLYDVFGDLHTICTSIRREQLAEHPLLRAMSSEWELSKLLLHFAKLVEQEVYPECLRVSLVEWIVRTQLDVSPEQCVLLIKDKQWFSYLHAYAQSYGIRLVSYRNPWGRVMLMISWVRELFKWILSILWRLILGQVRRPVSLPSAFDSSESPKTVSPPTASTIAVHYSRLKLSLDLAERSGFFWLIDSGIPFSEVLVYGFEKPLDAETSRQIKSQGFKLSASRRRFSTRRAVTVCLRVLLKLTTELFNCLRNRCAVEYYYIRVLVTLAMSYARWYDFYSSHQVRVNVGMSVNMSTAQALALDALDGVTIAYQQSVTMFIPFALFSSGEDVRFVFSPLFEQLLRSIKAPTDTFVSSGYISHRTVPPLRSLNRSSVIKQQIRDNGASFILCFFDENSGNSWNSLVSNEDTTNDYEYLLNWLLADNTLGLVFKPKKPATLFKRIGRIAHLVKRARQTGRCQFLTSTDNIALNSSIYPAEAALVADVCIGKLLGSTAALEARLAGIPAVLLDTEGLRGHPFYSWGRGRVVFEDWESLRTAIEKYRRAPEAYPEFGEWSPGINDLDPFQDGQASLRMGSYIHTLYEALKQGISKEDALAMAAEQFGQRWGHKYITLNRENL